MARTKSTAAPAVPASEGKAVGASIANRTITAIMKDEGRLSTFIDDTLTSYRSVGRAIHVALVSCLWHVATHGNPALLNKLFAGLRDNDQNAVRLYIRRAQIVIGLSGEEPDGQDSAILQAAFLAGQSLDMKNKQFIVVRGHTSDQAKALAKMCESRLIDPDGDKDKFVLDRNNISEHRTLGDADALEAIVSATTRFLENKSERRTVNLSKVTAKFLSDLRDSAQVMLGQATLDKG